MNRRDLIASLGGVAAARMLGVHVDMPTGMPQNSSLMPIDAAAPAFPRKADFSIEDGYTYLNAAYTHPIPNVAGSDVPKRLLAAKVNVRVAPHWLRVSPSVYNDMSDIDRLLNALS